MWSIRVRHAGGSCLLQRLAPDTPLRDFRVLVAKGCDLPDAAAFRVLAGQPPRLIGDNDNDSTLPISGFLVDRDTVTVEVALAVQPAVAVRHLSSQVQALLDPDRAPLDALGDLLALAALPVAERGVVDPVLGSFRRALQAARVNRSAETLASQRYTALLGTEYEILAAVPSVSPEGLPRFRVKFRTGPRSFHEEEHTGLPEPLLRVVVHQIVNDESARENLKAHNMALFSPRVFWSLARLYPDCPGDAALVRLLPGQDWAYLHSRKRVDSEKAAASKRQAAATFAGKPPAKRRKTTVAAAPGAAAVGVAANAVTDVVNDAVIEKAGDRTADGVLDATMNEHMDEDGLEIVATSLATTETIVDTSTVAEH